MNSENDMTIMNENKKDQDENKVILRGSVLSINSSQKMAKVRIVSESNNHGYKNFPAVILYDPVKQLKGISLRQKVDITGHLQNYGVRISGTDRRRTETIIVADVVEPTKRRLMKYFDEEMIDDEDGGTPPDQNECYATGKLVRVMINSTVPIIRICSEKKEIDPITGEVTILKRHSDWSCFRQQAEIASMIEPGSPVALAGYIATTQKIKDGVKYSFQNAICADICKL